jgi:hypothetical protein
LHEFQNLVEIFFAEFYQVLAHKDSLTKSFFIEVPVLSQKSEGSCICVLGGMNFASFYDFIDSILKLFRQCGILFYFFIFLYICNLPGHT